MTPQEAAANLADAREDYVTALIDSGLEVPLPEALGRIAQAMRDNAIAVELTILTNAVGVVLTNHRCAVPAMILQTNWPERKISAINPETPQIQITQTLVHR